MTVLLVPALYSAANMLAAGLSLVGLRICLAVLQRDVIMSLLIIMLAGISDAEKAHSLLSSSHV